jgi:hypothetical protein
MTKKEAIAKGYLEEKTIALKPSPRGATMGITNPAHIAYFQIEQGTTFFSLPRNERGDIVNPFKDEDERLYFEKELGLELNSSKPGNYFETFMVKIIKDSALMKSGESFKLDDPLDNLRWRILKNCPQVAPDWGSRKKRAEYRWALIDESQMSEEAEVEYDSQKEFWMMMGRHDDTPKMRSLLKIYFNETNSDKKITSDMSKKILSAEINTIFENITSRKMLLKITSDVLFPIKEMVIRGLECKAIVREGKDDYLFAGEEKTHTFKEITEALYESKDNDTEVYFKIKDQIEKAKE